MLGIFPVRLDEEVNALGRNFRALELIRRALIGVHELIRPSRVGKQTRCRFFRDVKHATGHREDGATIKERDGVVLRE